MPMITVDLTVGRTPEAKQAMAEKIIAAVAEHATVRPDQVWVRFNDVPRHDWVIGRAG